MTDNQMKDWRVICEAFCKQYGYELLFVKDGSFGVELKDGQFKHIYADELEDILKGDNNEN